MLFDHTFPYLKDLFKNKKFVLISKYLLIEYEDNFEFSFLSDSVDSNSPF